MTRDPFIYVSPSLPPLTPGQGRGKRALDPERILRARQDKTTKSPITNCYIGTAYQTRVAAYTCRLDVCEA